MKERVWVVSLGGSRIVPGAVDEVFLQRFRELILSYPFDRFVVVTGGGTTARRYINALRDLHGSLHVQSEMGVAVTRFHATFMMRFFGTGLANDELPFSLGRVRNLLRKNRIVFCGALRMRQKETTDATAARIAGYLKCPFINLTNVKGVFTDNPKEYSDAAFLQSLSWYDFSLLAKRVKYSAGQHFVLDQKAGRIILKKRVPTYIVGSLSDIDRIIGGDFSRFGGSLIYG